MSETDMTRSPITIVGAGISGLVLGQCLRRRNIPATIYERVKANPTRNNYGITLFNNTYRPLLETLNISEDDFKRRIAVHSPDGNQVCSDSHRLRVNRSAFTTLLQEGLDIQWEHKLSNIRANDTTRKAEFETPSGLQAPDCSLLIAADGVHSQTRSLLNLSSASFSLKVLPYIVFNGKRRIKPSNLPPNLVDVFATPDGITHAQDSTVLTIKADFWDPEKQTVAVSYTFARPSTAADQHLLDRNISDAETLAKHFVDEVAALGSLPAPFAQIFNTETMHEDRLLHWLMRSSLIEDKAIEQAAAESSVVLLGDAAHAQPIPGNGANEAILDALELAKHIKADGRVDVEAFLAARSKAWSDGRREAEEALEMMHGDGTARARI